LIKARKSLGQNFLTDARVSRRIVNAVSPQPLDIIIEIGPGTGALTRLLVEQSGYVVAVEIDSRLIEELRASLPASNLSVIEADALTVDWNLLLDDAIDAWRNLNPNFLESPRLRVVANLPYYISTPIIERLIGLRNRLADMTLMLQKEVVDRIASKPGSRDYGYLSVLVQFYCEAAKLFEVSPSAFRPAPKVHSAILRLTVRERPTVDVSDETKFIALVSAAFAQRRKTIANNLKAAASALKFIKPIEQALDQSGILPERRAETLTVEEFGALYGALFDD
jgi:16S rRNA (adenine1518-N6/adenine1519-N6)-dimethyltransferase